MAVFICFSSKGFFSRIYCDNATNFVGTRSQLEDFRQQLFDEVNTLNVHIFSSIVGGRSEVHEDIDDQKLGPHWANVRGASNDCNRGGGHLKLKTNGTPTRHLAKRTCKLGPL
ncbi:uncharacterized protein LOC121467271 [Drosophila elegans]|uniref:uncharacterized protein LOC121467271 n=1 Tax=Drosophila elegans TaxID=30023 RepID=UPI001BC84E1F|nr:uncharacterized protein LOC121467271 [Drosophila elegans]